MKLKKLVCLKQILSNFQTSQGLSREERQKQISLQMRRKPELLFISGTEL